MYQAGRDSIDQVIKNVLPFMAFISLIVGIILKSGIGDWLAKTLSPLAGSLLGLVVLSIIIAIPVLSPLLGPRSRYCVNYWYPARNPIRNKSYSSAIRAARFVRDQPTGWYGLYPGRSGAW